MATKTTATKKSTKAVKPDAAPQATVKFAKGAFYEDAKQNLWYCFSPKQKKTPDGHAVVQMQKTEDGVQVGEAGEEYTDTFVRELTKAELKEYRDACRREKEALADTETAANGGTETTTEQPAEPAKGKKPRKKREGKMGCLDAAAQVLADAGTPMSSMEMIEAMATQGLWTSPGGATPHATLFAAIIREIARKGTDARFAKTDRGRFAATNTTAPAAASAPEAATAAPADTTPAEGPEKPAKKGKKAGGKKASA